MNIKSTNKVILAIETSCDETAASVCINGKIYSNVIFQQEDHSNLGGVVPEIASRAHLKKINQVVSNSLEQANISITDVDALAIANGPGLMGSLLVGSGFAKGLASAHSIPMLPVDHLSAHIYAHFIDAPIPELPFACLLVSGGHTFIFEMNEKYQLSLIGKTIDDAAGEALDKCAKLMKLPYPGGPEIDRLSKMGNPNAFVFSKPKLADYNYSFSGLKTAFLNLIRNQEQKNPNFIEENLFDLCASIQKTIVDYLIEVFKKYLKDSQIRNIGISGGVAANSMLREAIANLGEQVDANFFIPDLSYCTDNAAMIAKAGDMQFDQLKTTEPNFEPYAKSPWKK